MRGRNWKLILGGSVWVIVAAWFWYQIGQPLHHELALIRGAHVVEGVIVNAVEDVGEGDEGQAVWSHFAEYAYKTPDGRQFSSATANFSGRLAEEFRNLEAPRSIQIEYLPDNPHISRIKGSGHDTVGQWLLYRVFLGGGLLALLVAPGALFVRRGLAEA